MQRLWSAALAPGTVSLYQSAYSLFKQFLELHCLWTSCSYAPPPVNEDIFMYFVTFCATKGLRYNTIKQYLAGIRYHYAAFNIPTLLASPSALGRLYTLLRGIKKSQSNVSRCRLPITYPILSDMLSALEKGFMGSYDGLMMSAACSMAFAAFLRAGELTILSNQRVNDSECLHIDDIEFMGNHSYVLILRSSKTDIFRRGVRIPVYSNHKRFCPVQIMTEYIKLRRCAGAIDSDPLFVSAKGFILSRCVFISNIRAILSSLGYDSSKFHGHSIRKGSASSCARHNISDHLIKTLGRWLSDCYTRYIHTDDDSIRNAQIKIMQLWFLTYSGNALEYANFMYRPLADRAVLHRKKVHLARFAIMGRIIVLLHCAAMCDLRFLWNKAKLNFWHCFTIDIHILFVVFVSNRLYALSLYQVYSACFTAKMLIYCVCSWMKYHFNVITLHYYQTASLFELLHFLLSFD